MNVNAWFYQNDVNDYYGNQVCILLKNQPSYSKSEEHECIIWIQVDIQESILVENFQTIYDFKPNTEHLTKIQPISNPIW